MNINQLLDLVIERSEANSLRQIASKLSLNHNSVAAWSRGRTFPVEENIEKLCELAGEDPNLWFLLIRQDAVNGSAKERWQRITADYVNSKSSPIHAET